MLMRWKDCPEQPKDKSMIPPGSENKVMHAQLRIGNTVVMASDGQCSGKPSFQGIWLALTAPDEGDAQRLFDALADVGKVQLPLTKTFFSPRFGMVTDCFGVSWMIQAASPAKKG